MSDPKCPPNYQDPLVADPEPLPNEKKQAVSRYSVGPDVLYRLLFVFQVQKSKCVAYSQQSARADYHTHRGNGIWRFEERDILWSTSGTGHCFLPTLSYIYDDQRHGMQCVPLDSEVGDRKDLFCSAKTNNRSFTKYYGTYECTRVATVDYSVVAEFSQKASPNHFDCDDQP